MATDKATGLIMPKYGDHEWEDNHGPINHPGYVPATAGTGLAQPGVPEGDTNLLQTDPVDDETSGSIEVGLIAVPSFPRLADQPDVAHAPQFTTSPRHVYIMNNSKYERVMVPAAVGDPATGLPEEEDDDDMWGNSASYAEKYTKGPAHEARDQTGAHEVDQLLGGDEERVTGATGVWAIAGRT